jgi:hypothetical protein
MFRNPWWLPAAGLVFFGLLIAIFPQLLALIVASAFITVGLSWLMAGWSFRRNRSSQTYYVERWF